MHFEKTQSDSSRFLWIASTFGKCEMTLCVLHQFISYSSLTFVRKSCKGELLVTVSKFENVGCVCISGSQLTQTRGHANLNQDNHRKTPWRLNYHEFVEDMCSKLSTLLSAGNCWLLYFAASAFRINPRKSIPRKDIWHHKRACLGNLHPHLCSRMRQVRVILWYAIKLLWRVILWNAIKLLWRSKGLKLWGLGRW